jgi:propanol-preferring alcohol dehydrogenase
LQAARLHSYRNPLVIEQAAEPKLRSKEGVVLKVAGAGLCHTDLAYIDGLLPDVRGKSPNFPYIMGHENSGYVSEIGDSVTGFSKGDPILVYGAVGCGTCEFCRKGEEQRCSVNPITIGLSPEYEGGFAEYMYVPSYKYLLKVEGNPTDLAPLTDAGLTSYRASKRVRNYLTPGSFSLIIGMGGLGMYALQYLKLMGVSSIITLDVVESKLEMARSFGADLVLNSRDSSVLNEIDSFTKNKGVKVIMDFVGIEATASFAMKLLSNDGIYVDIGLGGGSLSVPLINLIHTEAVITGNMWGTFRELEEAYTLAKTGTIKSLVNKVKLAGINEAINDLRQGGTNGRIVVTP